MTNKIFQILFTIYLFQVLKMMVGKNLKDDQIQQIANRAILYLDKVSLKNLFKIYLHS